MNQLHLFRLFFFFYRQTSIPVNSCVVTTLSISDYLTSRPAPRCVSTSVRVARTRPGWSPVDRSCNFQSVDVLLAGSWLVRRRSTRRTRVRSCTYFLGHSSAVASGGNFGTPLRTHQLRRRWPAPIPGICSPLGMGEFFSASVLLYTEMHFNC